MRRISRFSAALGGTLIGVGGCAPTESRGAPSVAPARAGVDAVLNGLHLNGLHLNGLHLNGLHLNGPHLDGSHLDGIGLDDSYLNGQHLNGVALAGGTLTAARPGGGLLSGADLTGATFDATLSDGSALTLRIDAVTRAADDARWYTVRYQLAGGGPFRPLCGEDQGGAVPALALAGSWDASEGTPTGGAHLETAGVFTFACRGYALAKCAELGYAPWRTATECRAPGDCHVIPLRPYHQACTRALRADYCGDGTPTTRDNTLIDLWDTVGLQLDEAAGWPLEAEWTPAGAACVARTRWSTIEDEGEPVTGYIAAHCPSRWQPETCGGATSTFPSASSGFTLPLGARALIRTRIDGTGED